MGAFCCVADLESLSPTQLIALIRELQHQIQELRRENEELRRGSGRSAAPFSKEQRKTDPQKPGRKPGQGPFLRRAEPEAGTRDRVTLAVAVESRCCPDCGGALEAEPTEVATVIDLPEKPQLVVQCYEVEVRRCCQCGRKVRGRHAGLPPDQHGATAHRLGPRVKAAAHALHYGWGVPVRKVPAILAELSGIQVTQSAITQDALKQAERSVGQAYRQLRTSVREAPMVHTDDTGWRMGGEPAQLMVFETDAATVFQVRARHRNEEVREIIPSDFAGVMIADRGKSYDAEELSEVAQQKCLSHLLRNVSEVVKQKHGRSRQFGLGLKRLLQESLQLWHDRKAGQALDYLAQVGRLERDLTHHLRDRVLKDADNQKLLDGIGLQHDCGHVLRFLHDPAVEPTNNRAERALRPAVVARKVSHCSRNQRGAETFAAFTSLAQTFRKGMGTSLTEAFRTLIQLRSSQSASP